MPDDEQVVHDLVKGEVRWGPGELRDFVIVRTDGSPVFLLAVAVDDLAMGVTHVVRGDDLLTAAPRNIAVIRALGGTPPAYAHLPQVRRSRSQAAVEAPRLDQRPGVPRAGVPAGGVGELPRAARVVARR